MCTNGTAAKIINGPDGTPDYGGIWGGEIALDFNNHGGDAGVKGDFDLSPFQGIEFDFSGDLIPNNAMAVNFPFTGEYGTSPPSWMGATSETSPLTVGHNIIKWADVGGPLYLAPTVPPPFDKTHVQTINFWVGTDAASTTPYSFCVANLALIPN
jgi:hypothetical protein